MAIADKIEYVKLDNLLLDPENPRLGRSLADRSQEEMLRTFNMGIGMLVVVPAKKFKKAQTLLDRAGEKFYSIGRIVKGERKVLYS